MSPFRLVLTVAAKAPTAAVTVNQRESGMVALVSKDDLRE